MNGFYQESPFATECHFVSSKTFLAQKIESPFKKFELGTLITSWNDLRDSKYLHLFGHQIMIEKEVKNS